MSLNNIQTTEDALEFMIECTLATVDDLSMKKKPPVGEYSRQIRIAQRGLDHLPDSRSCSGRTHNVIHVFGRSVSRYADSIYGRWHKDKT